MDTDQRTLTFLFLTVLTILLTLLTCPPTSATALSGSVSGAPLGFFISDLCTISHSSMTANCPEFFPVHARFLHRNFQLKVVIIDRSYLTPFDCNLLPHALPNVHLFVIATQVTPFTCSTLDLPSSATWVIDGCVTHNRVVTLTPATVSTHPPSTFSSPDTGTYTVVSYFPPIIITIATPLGSTTYTSTTTTTTTTSSSYSPTRTSSTTTTSTATSSSLKIRSTPAHSSPTSYTSVLPHPSSSDSSPEPVSPSDHEVSYFSFISLISVGSVILVVILTVVVIVTVRKCLKQRTAPAPLPHSKKDDDDAATTGPAHPAQRQSRTRTRVRLHSPRRRAPTTHVDPIPLEESLSEELELTPMQRRPLHRTSASSSMDETELSAIRLDVPATTRTDPVAGFPGGGSCTFGASGSSATTASTGGGGGSSLPDSSGVLGFSVTGT